MKMELIEGSETSAISIVTPGNYPKENILHNKSCCEWLIHYSFIYVLNTSGWQAFGKKSMGYSGKCLDCSSLLQHHASTQETIIHISACCRNVVQTVWSFRRHVCMRSSILQLSNGHTLGPIPGAVRTESISNTWNFQMLSSKNFRNLHYRWESSSLLQLWIWYKLEIMVSEIWCEKKSDICHCTLHL